MPNTLSGLCYTIRPKQRTIQLVAPRRRYMKPTNQCTIPFVALAECYFICYIAAQHQPIEVSVDVVVVETVRFVFGFITIWPLGCEIALKYTWQIR